MQVSKDICGWGKSTTGNGKLGRAQAMAEIQCTTHGAHGAQRSGGRGEKAIIYIEGWVLEKEPIEVGWW